MFLEFTVFSLLISGHPFPFRLPVNGMATLNSLDRQAGRIFLVIPSELGTADLPTIFSGCPNPHPGLLLQRGTRAAP
jgi:hypothetical protein